MVFIFVFVFQTHFSRKILYFVCKYFFKGILPKSGKQAQTTCKQGKPRIEPEKMAPKNFYLFTLDLPKEKIFLLPPFARIPYQLLTLK